ncbi:probable calcium-binding protein CML44 [Ricinus communis]|uniref:Calcium binding protein/cast, putative n=1 Tax=Ricinus communis TaxID=3988 RepID=B9S2S9_RICCO|nr:probable calcium-binding protein CML44 [Ricinus communis]EEF42084.1 calcium binding protein/cast, putative [Ricinus communis]|eukprot:XP_002520298.1 probable calcium-binding protein CML44 [Ricinus communis]
MCPLITRDLHRIFQKLDKNGDGLLSIGELNWLLEKIGVHFSPEELEGSVGKSSLDFNEFLLFYDSITECSYGAGGEEEEDEVVVEEEEEGSNKELEDLAKAFNVFDINGDGFISSEELQSVLARLGLWDEMSGKDCTSMICAFDTNLDGVLDFEEFKNMMLQTSS